MANPAEVAGLSKSGGLAAAVCAMLYNVRRKRETVPLRFKIGTGGFFPSTPAGLAFLEDTILKTRLFPEPQT